MFFAIFLAIEVFKSPHNTVHDELLERQLFTEYSELEYPCWDQQGSPNPTPKRMAYAGIKLTILALLALCSNQLTSELCVFWLLLT